MKTTTAECGLKKRMASMAVAAIASATVASAAAVGGLTPGTAYAAETGSATFSQAGISSWTVPPNVNVTMFEIRGARGGHYGNPFFGGYAGGNGGVVMATLPVTPGETLSVLVGVIGDYSDAGLVPGLGGLGGGGNGGRCGAGPSSACESGAGGGGSSGVYRGTTTLLLAGGGGGAAALGACGAGGELT